MKQEEKDKLHKAANEYANSIAQHDERKTYCVEDFIAGAEWADEHPINYDGKAYLYVGNKCAELTKKDLINKACEWLEENLLNYWSQINANDTDDFIENFKNYMKGE